MTFAKLSAKQKAVFKWCYNSNYKALICDGAVRSGKTICMITSFILWAMRRFNGATFGICGKSVGSAERNIIMPLQAIVDITKNFKMTYTRSIHLLTIEGMGKVNYFYVFGGKDESSYMLIQGITLSGVFLDEVALMPKSFVNQAITRTLSVENSLYWFNCNPDSSEHWFFKEWIQKAEERNALHLHFLMSDNPTLSQKQLDEAEHQFSGVFHDRYIKGLWVLAEGLVYSMFDKNRHILDNYKPTPDAFYYISCDYGTLNPCSMGLWASERGKAVRIKEFYYDGRNKGVQKTDEEYYRELEKLADGYNVQFVIVDPSASSFITTIKAHKKFRVHKADNDVLDGIRRTSTLIENNQIFICKCCKDIIREFSLYCWDSEKPHEKDTVIKENDHAMDDMRYFVNSVMLRTLKENARREEGYSFD